MSTRPAKESERNQEATVYIGNIDENADDELICELMIQAGPLVSVHLPKDRVNQVHQGFGFAEYLNERDAEYAALIMNGVRLYGKVLRVNKALLDKQKAIDVGADLYIGNLDSMVDEGVLADTFSVFGNFVNQPKVARDPDTGAPKGYGFVSFDSFEASDRALESMNGQYLMNKPLVINYAYKRDGKGERHGDEAERLLAAQAQKNNYKLPSQLPQQPQLPLQQLQPPPIPPPFSTPQAQIPQQYPPQHPVPQFGNMKLVRGPNGIMQSTTPMAPAASAPPPAFPAVPPPFLSGPPNYDYR